MSVIIGTREFTEKEVGKIKELEKLTTDELREKREEIQSNLGAIETAIKASIIINVYKEEGFIGLLSYIEDNDLPS